jgi:hypothetical protein
VVGTRCDADAFLYQIEQPFDVLPLRTFCQTLRTTIESMTPCQKSAFEILTQAPPLLAPDIVHMVRNSKFLLSVNWATHAGILQIHQLFWDCGVLQNGEKGEKGETVVDVGRVNGAH